MEKRSIGIESLRSFIGLLLRAHGRKLLSVNMSQGNMERRHFHTGASNGLLHRRLKENRLSFPPTNLEDLVPTFPRGVWSLEDIAKATSE